MAWACREFGAHSWASNPLTSLLVNLDRGYRSQRSIVWVHPGIAAGATLTQQVPALVEGDLDSPEPFQLIVAERGARMRLFQAMFFAG
jgi:hypothetical protein